MEVFAVRVPFQYPFHSTSSLPLDLLKLVILSKAFSHSYLCCHCGALRPLLSISSSRFFSLFRRSFLSFLIVCLY
jgi:hypothetical protein